MLPWTFAVEFCAEYTAYRDVVRCFLRAMDALRSGAIAEKRRVLALVPEWGEPPFVREGVGALPPACLSAIDATVVRFPERRLRDNEAARVRSRVVAGVKARQRVALRAAFADDLQCPGTLTTSHSAHW